jgi:hypothetical protein
MSLYEIGRRSVDLLRNHTCHDAVAFAFPLAHHSTSSERDINCVSDLEINMRSTRARPH